MAKKEARPDSGIRLCPDCDLMINTPVFNHDPAYRQQAACPRCGCMLESHRPAGIQSCLALVVTGLILFIPANYYPVLSMNILGNEQQSTISGGVVALYQGDYGAIALLVLLSAILIPLLRFLILLKIILSAITSRGRRVSRSLLRLYTRLQEWGMTEIYFLGALVAVIKLADMATVQIGTGLYCFAGLMLCELIIALNLNEHEIWAMLGEDE
ncbi:paraquat-inducible protein A [Endozoicomonas sp. 8E]|uniref:paraquat-inducible protein A n=1 Tax=Endozoicomonas sp. 8E TaxID=3035692 RepID=UPI002939010C|nr:paraquat-inducible protein A [Endozoicomonas sp. 8E]WOG27777.1 paraquat-inducible protein A [Endozoicomonas sp. 8E]